MQRARGGYTIIEVMIVLAVSGVLFTAAITLFQGKNGRTQFSQAMRDADSKIQSVVSDVNSDAFPGSGQYDCTASPGKRPVLKAAIGPSDTTGTNGDCIYLGKALEADTNNAGGAIKIYTILSSRLDATSAAVTTFPQATPEPIMGPPPLVDLTEIYTLLSGVTITQAGISTTINPPPVGSETDMVGYYNSLGGLAQNGQSLTSFGYSGFDSQTGNVQNTLSTQINSLTVTPIQAWYLCFASATSNEFARIIVRSSPSGVTTSLNFGMCNPW